jgi:hypothetical protein
MWAPNVCIINGRELRNAIFFCFVNILREREFNEFFGGEGEMRQANDSISSNLRDFAWKSFRVLIQDVLLKMNFIKKNFSTLAKYSFLFSCFSLLSLVRYLNKSWCQNLCLCTRGRARKKCDCKFLFSFGSLSIIRIEFDIFMNFFQLFHVILLFTLHHSFEIAFLIARMR